MRNPIRRNRKIGKTQGGRVQNGKASEKWSRIFPDDVFHRLFNSDKIWQTYVENPSKYFYHPCSPEEYIEVLKRLPSSHTKYVKAIILKRVSKHDQKFLIEASMKYHCIFMNAFPISNKFEYSKKPSDSEIKHYEPFCQNWTSENGTWTLNWEKEEVKRYYLYHLFLHEIGHFFQPFTSSKYRKENYAESYARDMASWLGEI